MEPLDTYSTPCPEVWHPMLFSLPVELRNYIWAKARARARFFALRDFVEAHLVSRKRPELITREWRGFLAKMASVRFKLSDTKTMELTEIVHYYGLEGRYCVLRETLPVHVQLMVDWPGQVVLGLYFGRVEQMWYCYAPRGGWYCCPFQGAVGPTEAEAPYDW